MTSFIGREKELQRLKDLDSFRRAVLVVVKGRRRIGKSRLIEEAARGKRLLKFSGVPPVRGTTAQDQRDVFAQQFALQFRLPPLTFTDWMNGFSHITEQLTEEPTLLLLDEISWMGAKDPTFVPKLKNWWDLEAQKFPQLQVVFCGSVSTWIEDNILNSTAFFGRVSLTLTLEDLPLSDGIRFLQARGVKGSDYDLFKLLCIAGGVPWYLEQMSSRYSADENIKRLAFEKDGIFTVEFDKIFHDLFKKRSGIYKKVLRALGEGMKSLEEIREELGYARSGTLSKMIRALMVSGFVSEHYTWDVRKGKIGRSKLYRLSDCYLRFFLKYIEPHLAKINQGSYPDIALSQLPGFETMLGFQLESLLLKNRPLILQALGINPVDVICDNPYLQREAARRPGCQIDYLIQTRTKNLYICEFKFNRRELGPEIIEEVQRKEKNLLAPKGYGKIAVLFHMGGVASAVHDSLYFFRIIDVTELVYRHLFLQHKSALK